MYHSELASNFIKSYPINPLKDKSVVGLIVDYSRDYTVVNGVQYFFHFFSISLCSVFVLMRFCCIKASRLHYSVFVQRRRGKHMFLCVHIAPVL